MSVHEDEFLTCTMNESGTVQYGKKASSAG